MHNSDVEEAFAYKTDKMKKCHKNVCVTDMGKIYGAHLFPNTSSACPFHRHFLYTVFFKTNQMKVDVFMRRNQDYFFLIFHKL